MSAVARHPRRVLPERFVKPIRDVYPHGASDPDVEPMAWPDVWNLDAPEVAT